MGVCISNLKNPCINRNLGLKTIMITFHFCPIANINTIHNIFFILMLLLIFIGKIPTQNRTQTWLRPTYSQWTTVRSKKRKKRTTAWHMLIYRTYVTLTFSADIARADFNGNYKYSTSALSRPKFHIDTQTLFLYRY